ncbi:MAG: zinc ribbon domain-containing protein [Anaerolineales bacterium]|nr:zinc ribbon domain-containing protein [Anaerolineales bacterium]
MGLDACPQCQQATLVRDERGHWVCPACGYRIQLETFFCSECGAENPIAAQVCIQCGQSLSTFRQVMDRHTGEQLSPLWLKQVRAQASSLKEQARMASEERSLRFEEIDQRRIESERIAKERQALREKKTIRAAAMALLATAFLLTVLAILLRL